MSGHYTPMHARDGQRRDALYARARDTWTRVAGWLRGETPSSLRHPIAALEWGWRWCHWRFVIRPRYVGRLRAALDHATPAALTAPDGWPVQAHRPTDPPPLGSAARCGPGQPQAPGAVSADHGTGPDAGACPAPAAADAADPPAADAAPLSPPAPSREPPGRGQPDHLWPGGPVTAPGESRQRVEQQAARAPQRPAWVITQPPPGMPAYLGDYRPTQPFRAVSPAAVNVIRPYYPAHQARRDSTARWTA